MSHSYRSAHTSDTTASPTCAPINDAGVDNSQMNAALANTHTVASGETLSVIARAHTGDANRWRELYEANQDQITNPNVIRLGEQLRLPESWVDTAEAGSESTEHPSDEGQARTPVQKEYSWIHEENRQGAVRGCRDF